MSGCGGLHPSRGLPSALCQCFERKAGWARAAAGDGHLVYKGAHRVAAIAVVVLRAAPVHELFGCVVCWPTTQTRGD